MRAIILSIGDELVLGQTLDTNSAYLSEHLASIGCAVLSHITVADDQAAIESAIRESYLRCNVLLISGGLGPTEDDLTRQALAAVMNAPLELNASWLAKLEEFFRIRNRPMVASNRIQAMLPRGCRMIDNTCGTACGMAATLDQCDVYVMPGVPHEMKVMFQQDVLPHLRDRSDGAVILSRTLHTYGLGESSVGELLGPLMDRRRNPSVGTTVSGGIVSLRLNARFPSLAQATEQLAQTETACRERLGNWIFGADDTTLPDAVASLLKSNRVTVATAESCTGGLLSGMLTQVPGSSSFFLQGWVTYTNDSKTRLLGVREETLARHGAVSEAVVSEMADAARRISGANFALAISGIAGPDGGTPEKPVGTICIGFAHADGVRARTIILMGDRQAIRDRACKSALTILRYHLINQPTPF